MTDTGTASGGAVMVAVGAHIGDMDLAAGPALAQNVLDGGTSILVALTPGERGHPRMSAADYREQKLTEGARLAEAIGAQFEAFDDLSDGFLADDEPTAQRLARLLRRHRPDTVLAHWRHSIHSDHRHASALTERARFLSGLPGWEVDEGDDGSPERRRHGIGRLLFTENWEDAEGFTPEIHVPISEEAYQRWRAGISTHAFARGETYGFRYIDYYAAQLIMRGCLARTERAVAFGLDEGSPMTRLMPMR